MSLYNEEEIIGAIDSKKHEMEESDGEQLLMIGQNLQNVATEEQQTPIVQQNICECVWCKPYFSDSINELTENVKLQLTDLELLKEAANQKNLLTHPGETSENTSLQINLARSVVDSTMAHFLSAASEGNIDIANIAARNTGNALRNMTQFIGCFVSTLSETEKQFEIINMAKEVLLKSMRLINEAQKALCVQDQTNKENLALAAIDVSLSLNKAMICIPAPGQLIEDGTTDTIGDLDKMAHSANVNSKCPKDSNKGGENKSVYLLHL